MGNCKDCYWYEEHEISIMSDGYCFNSANDVTSFLGERKHRKVNKYSSCNEYEPKYTPMKDTGFRK